MLLKEQLLQLLSSSSLDSDIDILNALKVAYTVHKSEVRENGHSYLEEHIYPMTQNVYNSYQNQKSLKVLLLGTILHDTLESSEISNVTILNGFSNDVIDIVTNLTKTKEENEDSNSDSLKSLLNHQYIRRIMQCSNEVVIIKLEDRLSNLQSTSKEVVLKRISKYIRYVGETPDQFYPLADIAKTHIDYRKLIGYEVERLRKILGPYL